MEIKEVKKAQQYDVDANMTRKRRSKRVEIIRKFGGEIVSNLCFTIAPYFIFKNSEKGVCIFQTCRLQRHTALTFTEKKTGITMN